MALVVFVCTGNMCRSPMAEGIAAASWDGPGAMRFESCGTATYDGSGATRPAIDATAELGVSLLGHRSRPVSAAALADADAIYGMTGGHVAEICRAVPEVADRVELLDPAGADIADPYGLSLEFYRQIRDEIARAIEARMPDWRRAISG